MNRTQAYRTPPWKKQTKTILEIITIGIVALIIAMGYLYFSAQLSEIRINIQSLHAKRNSLIRQIAEYQTRTGALTSFSMMRQRAENAGYIDIDFYNHDLYEYVVLDGYNPNNRYNDANNFRPVPPPVSPLRPEYTISLQQVLERELRNRQNRITH